MTDDLYPAVTRDLAHMRRELAPDADAAFHEFGKAVFAEGALSTKIKNVIAVAVAHVTQCPYCIRGHTRAALREGATHEELMEAIWVAAEMRAGGAVLHFGDRDDRVSERAAAMANGHPAPASATGEHHGH